MELPSEKAFGRAAVNWPREMGLAASCMVAVIAGSFVAATIVPAPPGETIAIALRSIALATIPLFAGIALLGIPLLRFARRRRLANRHLAGLGLLLALAAAVLAAWIASLIAGYSLIFALILWGLPIMWCAGASVLFTLPLARRRMLCYTIGWVYTGACVSGIIMWFVV